MMPYVLVLIFMAIWLSLAGMFFVFLVATGFQTGEWSQAQVPAGMFVFGILLSCGAFHAEAGKGRKLITAALTAQADPPRQSARSGTQP
jgi:hypothetical protein